MIYVSSSCVKTKRIGESVKILAEAGFKNIELSGGTEPYAELENDLLSLQDRFGINYLCHNYFPPPEQAFVLNLAALDQTSALSLRHCKRAIALSEKLGAKQFAFHAGFLINIPLDQIGKKIAKRQLFEKSAALNTFHKHLNELMEYASAKLDLYIENNVLSKENYAEFESRNPFFFTHAASLSEAKGDSGIGHLLDLAHLHVSANSLGLNFQSEVDQLIDQTDYIHISENKGERDENMALKKDSEILNSIKNKNLVNKSITLETYTDLEGIQESYEIVQSII
jgi:sugar phosphate isomerase/epimerase